MFNLFKRHNKKNIKGTNTLVIAEGCSNDACVEPTKELVDGVLK